MKNLSILIFVGASAEALSRTLDCLREQAAQSEVLLVPAEPSAEVAKTAEDGAAENPGWVSWLGSPGEACEEAWNRALSQARGSVIGFLDAGDWVSKGALDAVTQAFLRQEEREDGEDGATAMVRLGAVPEGGKAPDRDKAFTMGRKGVKLPLACPSSFFRREALAEARFDARLGELAELKFMLEWLAEHPKYLRIAGGQYRAQRQRGETPTCPTEAYLAHLWIPVAERCVQRQGSVPAFVQQCCLQHFPRHGEEKGDYAPPSLARELALLEQALALVDDKQICNQKGYHIAEKVFLLQKKHRSPGRVEKTAHGKTLFFGETAALYLEKQPVQLKIFAFTADAIEVEASYSFLPGLLTGEGAQLRLNGKQRPVEVYQREVERYLLGQPVQLYQSMRGRIPNQDLGREVKISFHATEAGGATHRRTVKTKDFVPFTDQLRYSYCMHRGMKYQLVDGVVTARPCGLGGHILSELLLLANIFKRGRELNPLLARILAKLYRPLLKNRVWLMIDRANKGGDNAEALFRYAMTQGIKGRKIYFVIDRNSETYRELIREYPKNVLPYMNWKHKLLVMVPGDTISAHITHTVPILFGNRVYYYADLVAQNRNIYLKHGILQKDTSRVIGKLQKNLGRLFTATRAEYQAMLSYPNGYDESVIKLTGLPRYDLLYRNEKRRIVVFPTWRKYLMEKDRGSRIILYKPAENAGESEYVRFYNGLLSHPALLDTAEELGYTVCFKPHPNADTKEMKQLIKADPRVRILDFYEPYRKMFAENDLMVTDYSSVAFDFAYLEKPVIYCPFDEDLFFDKGNFEKGYFDLRRDGFGEVETTLEDTAQRIMEYMRGGCRMKPEYLRRVRDTFAFVDKENCKRVLDEILAFDREQDASS